MTEHEQIRQILLQHRGKENALKSPEIAELIGIDPGPSNVNIRTKITETLRMYSLPIAGNPSIGYFLIQNREELLETLDSLQSRMNKINERMLYINAAYYRFYEDQDLILTDEYIDPEDL
ncbi:MAG: hypothetical protein ACFFD2_13275 [Promethearchaeota archaeon]